MPRAATRTRGGTCSATSPSGGIGITKAPPETDGSGLAVADEGSTERGAPVPVPTHPAATTAAAIHASAPATRCGSRRARRGLLPDEEVVHDDGARPGSRRGPD